MPQKDSQILVPAAGVKTLPGREGSLCLRIQAAMRARIATGEWPSGQSLPGRVQLCEEFSTTRVTMDKAIQALVAEGILRSTKRVGTFVMEPGEKKSSMGDLLPSQRTFRTLRIGVVIERQSKTPEEGGALDDNFYFGPLFQGIRNVVSGKQIETLFAYVHSSEYLRFFDDSALDGVVLVAPAAAEMSSLRHLQQIGVPFVAVGVSSSDPQDVNIPCQDTANRQGAQDAVQHLLDLGHRRIGIVNLATALSNHHDRMEGYLQTLAAAGLKNAAKDLVLLSGYNIPLFEDRVDAWVSQGIASNSLPTAIFTCDYMMTLATLRVLRRHGLRVPEDISIVGFDDPLSAAHLTPALTTVRQPVYDLGRRAAERLLESLQGSDDSVPHGLELLSTELVIRESTCPPRADDLFIRRKALVS